MSRLRFLLAYFFFWILFFQGARLLFLLYNLSGSASFGNKALSFLYGLRMDLSAASYLAAPVCLLVLLSIFLPFFRRAIIYQAYSYVVLLLVLLITVADLEVYKSWGFRMDATPLKYLNSPKEAWASISHLPIFLILLVFSLVYAGLCLLLKKFIRKRMHLLQTETKKIPATVALLLATGFLIVPMRGGFQLTPMNQSMVYFSKENFANVAAVNATWNFLNGLAKGASTDNPYRYLDSDVAKAIVDSLYVSGNGIRPVLKTKTPNVIVVIWESFTEKATRQLIEGKPITPYFNQLRREGIYFSNAYASGDRTDKGVAAVLSGYPAMNKVSIIRFPNKSARLHTLAGFFKERNYSTSFYYGGETEFANIKSYLLHSGYDRLIDKNDFSAKDQNSKWGAHDGVVAKKLLADLNTMKAPFFSTWLTLSSHEPFETPARSPFSGNDHATQFAGSLHYTDKIMNDFIQACRQQPWWDNTVLIIVADHGHTLLEPSTRIDNFKIPMLWLGGALSETGVEITQPVSQLDLAATLTGQIDANAKLFPFSKNSFDTTSKAWAYFSFNNGFGLVQPQQFFVFDNVGGQVIMSSSPPVGGRDLRAGKALQQFTFEDYISK